MEGTQIILYGLLHAYNTLIISKEIVHKNTSDLGCTLITNLYMAKQSQTLPPLYYTVIFLSSDPRKNDSGMRRYGKSAKCRRLQNPLHL